MKLTEPGQIKPGDIIHCEFKGNIRRYFTEEVLYAGTEREEVIIDLDFNKYFLTKMALDGSSWAKNVHYIPKNALMEWVRIDQSQPEPGVPVVVYRPLANESNDPLIRIATRHESTRVKTKSPQGVEHEFDCWCHVTHWMPLPAPPSKALEVSQNG